MEKTLSQKIACALSIINVILLVPMTLIEVYFGGWVVKISFEKMSFEPLILLLLLLAPYVLGNLLLWGYFKHAGGKVSPSKGIVLWIGTIFFNGIPFLVQMAALFEPAPNLSLENTGGILFWNVAFFYGATVAAGFLALANDLQKLNGKNSFQSITASGNVEK